MAKTRNDTHDPHDFDLDWFVAATHVTDQPDQPFRDYHAIEWGSRLYAPSPAPWWGWYVYLYSRDQAHGLALILAHNPGLITDACRECHWPYYLLNSLRWETLKPPPTPDPYISWPSLHRGQVPACISFDFNWSWIPDPPTPYEP